LLSDAIGQIPFKFSGWSRDQLKVEVLRDAVDRLQAQPDSRATVRALHESRKRALVDASGLADRVSAAAGAKNRRSQLIAERAS
jgi:hypothetical protein